MTYDLPARDDDLQIGSFLKNIPMVLHLGTIRNSIVYELLAGSEDDYLDFFDCLGLCASLSSYGALSCCGYSSSCYSRLQYA